MKEMPTVAGCRLALTSISLAARFSANAQRVTCSYRDIIDESFGEQAPKTPPKQFNYDLCQIMFNVFYSLDVEKLRALSCGYRLKIKKEK